MPRSRNSSRNSTPDLKANNIIISSNNQSFSSQSSGRTSSLVDEKAELRFLNDRFASYIEFIRKIQILNNGDQSTDSKCGILRSDQIMDIREIFEKELSAARSLLNEISQEKTRSDLQITRLEKELKEIDHNHKEALKIVTSLTQSNEKFFIEVESLKTKISRFETEKSQSNKIISDLKDELNRKENEINSLNEKIVEETLSRVNAQNDSISLKEEIDFGKKVYQAEVNKKVEYINTLKEEIESLKSSKTQESEFLLTDHLQLLREDLEAELYQAKETIEEDYKQRLNTLQTEYDKLFRYADQEKLQKLSLTSDFEDLKCKFNVLNDQKANLQDRIKELESQRDVERNYFESSMKEKEDRIAEITEQHHCLMFDYEELLNAKLSLGMEIEAYRRLLECEEKRLKTDFSPKGKRTFSQMMSSPEPVLQVTASSDSFLKFVEWDADNGQYIKIKSDSSDCVNLSGFKIVHTNKKTNTISDAKFPQKSNISPDGYLTLWAGVKNDRPPTDIKFRKIHSWFTNDADFSIVLFDSSDKKLAEMEIKNHFPLQVQSDESTPKRRRMGPSIPSPRKFKIDSSENSHSRQSCTIM